MHARSARSGKIPSGRSFWGRHSLTITAAAILILWLVLYIPSNPESHIGSLLGNAIADWTGVLITVVATKYFYEIGSHESKKPRREYQNRAREMLHEHSLTIFLVLTGIGLIVIYGTLVNDTQSRWGTVVSNLISEWSQQIGLILLTKKLIEVGSKES
jgi:hypothetical protein